MLSGKLGGGGAPPAATEAGPGPPAADPPPLRVRVKRMRARSHAVVLTVRGRSEAGRRVDLRAETDGRIVEIGASRGDNVHKGDLLARLADEGRLAKVAEYRARLRQHEIHYEATAELSRRGLSSREALATAKADIDAARAAVEQIEVEIARTRLRAPFDGLLLEGHADFGDYLAQGDSFGHIIDLLATNRTVRFCSTRVVRFVLSGSVVVGPVEFVGERRESVGRRWATRWRRPRAVHTSRRARAGAKDSAHKSTGAFIAPPRFERGARAVRRGRWPAANHRARTRRACAGRGTPPSAHRGSGALAPAP